MTCSSKRNESKPEIMAKLNYQVQEVSSLYQVSRTIMIARSHTCNFFRNLFCTWLCDGRVFLISCSVFPPGFWVVPAAGPTKARQSGTGVQNYFSETTDRRDRKTRKWGHSRGTLMASKIMMILGLFFM